jgi:uncharacterized SAM-binding protein YcdF (DUF218 family)
MYQVLVAMLDPFLLLFLGTLAGVANLWRKGEVTRTRLWMATAPVAALALVCNPTAAYLALGSLEWAYPAQARRPADIQAIVVLGGYLRPADPEHGRYQPELWIDSADRCRMAVMLYRDGPACPLVVTGAQKSSTLSGPELAHAMKQFLVDQKVPQQDVLVEDRSLSTYENAAYTAPLLKERGIRRIAIVTDATHLRRAESCFRAQGFDVVPCASSRRTADFEWSPLKLLPSLSAGGDVDRVLHEWLGILWYRLRGRT